MPGRRAVREITGDLHTHGSPARIAAMIAQRVAMALCVCAVPFYIVNQILVEASEHSAISPSQIRMAARPV